jgi:hypothetical protein
MTPAEHLTTDQLDALRAEIVAETARLAARMESSADTVRPVALDPGAVGRQSRMDEMQNQAMAKSLRDREQHRLADLQGALRLEAYPETATCMACLR